MPELHALFVVTPEAKFAHDCTACAFIGHMDGHDVYVCPQHGIPTVVARYGSEGPEYISGRRIELENIVFQLRPDGSTSLRRESEQSDFSGEIDANGE